MKESWNYIFNDINNIFKKVDDYRKEMNKLNLKVFPANEYIFKAFDYFEFNETKVVILGQDPYHGVNQSTGLAFAINSESKIPPSLRNIKKELKFDLDIDLEDNSLEKWAKQGVLLLNASLTVVEGKPNSHVKLWDEYTNKIIFELNKLDNLVFVSWGAFALNKLKDIDIDKHSIIVSSHPSPLSFKKKLGNYECFDGSKPFSKINLYLQKMNKKTINW